MTDTVLIETRKLTKSFGGLQVLKGVDLQVHQGEAIAVIGPSGGGKSTFLRCLNLLEEPDGGDVIFEGQKINRKGTDVDRYRQKMGMVFQHFNVFPHMTVQQNVTLAPVLLKKKTQAEADEQALRLRPCASWIGSGCWTRRTSTPASSPAGRSSGWPSCGPWLWSRT